ncbi:RNA polymerase III transcription factor IIIC subunit-domain-containing protein [Absidia repens]|uniref:RNA polymerase III transcription factor IIIC subunit-domain-containing protein n=1 Tax=Absidia repens TaxID=90262 RepID=A0A1X2IKA5_9FUNG|nr:RNA polymerase III transcription factor IIIC subunit-domain-containing protein [Absidia repens]
MDPDYEQAPVYPVGDRKFLCVEYPGIVKNIDRVLETLGGERAISQAYGSSDSEPLELRYRPKDPFCHAINGSMVPSSRVLVKVTRRRRKDQPEDEGQLTTEVVGTIPQTCRFRGMADFQYLVPKSDSARKLRTALLTGDAKSIQQLRIPLDIDNHDKNLHAIPPPVFSQLETPFKYEYKQNAPVVRVRVQQADGTYVTKLVNRSKTKTHRHIVLSFETKNVPTKPPALDVLNEELLSAKQKLVELFDERPIWSKFALRNTLDPGDSGHLSELLPHVAYSFQNGPWRDCWIKYGVDPRLDQKYACYQQVDIRIGHPDERPTNTYVRAKRTRTLPVFTSDYPQRSNGDTSSKGEEHTYGRLFDGKHLPARSAWFQVCDITDPDFDCILRTTKYQHSTPPTKHSGYFYPSALVAVRSAMRQKIKQLNEDGHCERIPDMNEDLDEKIKKDKEKLAKGLKSGTATTAAAEATASSIKQERQNSDLESNDDDDDAEYNYSDDDDNDNDNDDNDDDDLADRDTAVADEAEMMDIDDWN